jgi:hypothetical protein
MVDDNGPGIQALLSAVMPVRSATRGKLSTHDPAVRTIRRGRLVVPEVRTEKDRPVR